MSKARDYLLTFFVICQETGWLKLSLPPQLVRLAALAELMDECARAFGTQ